MAVTGILSALLGLLVLQQQRDSWGEPVEYLGLFVLAAFLIPLWLVMSWGRDDTTALFTLVLLSACALLGPAVRE